MQKMLSILSALLVAMSMNLSSVTVSAHHVHRRYYYRTVRRAYRHARHRVQHRRFRMSKKDRRFFRELKRRERRADHSDWF